MATAQVIGFDAAITLGGLGAHFELNTMLPLMAYNLLQGITWLANATRAFAVRCVRGLEADVARCQALMEGNLALATALTPLIGYDAAASIAQEAYRSGRTVREVALERGVASPERLAILLDPLLLTMNSGVSVSRDVP